MATRGDAAYITFPDGVHRFGYVLSRSGKEVWGFIEANDIGWRLIPGTSGWYRTESPDRAAEIAYAKLEVPA